MPLYRSTTKNAIQKTLAAQLLSTATTGDPISFSDVDGVPNSPGVVCLDRIDSNGTETASKREYISYSGTSGTTLLIATRNVDGSGTVQTHAAGAVAEFSPDVTWAEAIYTALGNMVNTSTLAVDTTKLVTPTTLVPSLSGATLTGVTVLSGVLASGATVGTFTPSLGSDAVGDTYYRHLNGQLVRLGIGASGTVLTANATTPAWAAPSAGSGSITDEDTTGTSATSSSTYANITGADVAVTITKTSNILLLATVQAYGNVDLAPYTIQWHDGSANIGGSSRVYLRSSNPRTTVAINTVVVNKAPGTYTYTLQHKSEDNSSTLTAETFSCIAVAIPA